VRGARCGQSLNGWWGLGYFFDEAPWKEAGAVMTMSRFSNCLLMMLTASGMSFALGVQKEDFAFQIVSPALTTVWQTVGAQQGAKSREAGCRANHLIEL
jgi:hypothetical protein